MKKVVKAAASVLMAAMVFGGFTGCNMGVDYDDETPSANTNRPVVTLQNTFNEDSAKSALYYVPQYNCYFSFNEDGKLETEYYDAKNERSKFKYMNVKYYLSDDDETNSVLTEYSEKETSGTFYRPGSHVTFGTPFVPGADQSYDEHYAGIDTEKVAQAIDSMTNYELDYVGETVKWSEWHILTGDDLKNFQEKISVKDDIKPYKWDSSFEGHNLVCFAKIRPDNGLQALFYYYDLTTGKMGKFDKVTGTSEVVLNRSSYEQDSIIKTESEMGFNSLTEVSGDYNVVKVCDYYRLYKTVENGGKDWRASKIYQTAAGTYFCWGDIDSIRLANY